MKDMLSVKDCVLVAMTLMLVPILLIELFGVAMVRKNMEAFQNDAPGMPRFTELLIGGAVSLLLIGVRLTAVKALLPLGRAVLSPQKRVVEDRVLRFATVLFKFIYFVCITLVGFKVMHDEPWFPAALGGKGEILKSVDTFSQPPSSALKYYFLVQLGYHLHSLLFTVFLSPIRSDFIEMLLHHVATIILIAGSFLTNYMAYGAVVVFTHDVGDVTGYGIKSVVDTGNTPLLLFMYAMLLISWAYTRLFVLPYHLIYPATLFLRQNDSDHVIIYALPMIVTLCFLVVLHIYWYSLFLVMGYTLLKKGVAEDIQQKVGGPSDVTKGEGARANSPCKKSKND
uniref:TLC domain-containing protein n=1 Tax=Peronospora matthiolae TaxID=2874970 RepID=A0AAV1TR36_9STRA